MALQRLDHERPGDVQLAVALPEVALVLSRLSQPRANEIAGASARQNARDRLALGMQRFQGLLIGEGGEVGR